LSIPLASRGFRAARFLEVHSSECCVLSGRGLRDGLITCPTKCGVSERDREASRIRSPWPTRVVDAWGGGEISLYCVCVCKYLNVTQAGTKGGGGMVPNHSKLGVSGCGRSLLRPWPLHPRERPRTHCTEGWVGLGVTWTARKNLPFRWDSIPGPSNP
jgi:hypothetical protein